MRVPAIAALCAALLGGVLTAQSNRVEPVGQGGPIHYFRDTATLTVDSVTLGFMPATAPLSDPRKSGKQFVRLAVTVTNTGKTVFPMNYTTLSLQTSDFTRHGTTSSINKGNRTDRLGSDKLQPGASVSGALYYEISGKETRDALKLVYDGHAGSDDKDFLFPLTAAKGGENYGTVSR